jgi:ribosome-binding factor A
MSSFRIKQVNQVILEDLAKIIQNDIIIPSEALVTVLSVVTSKDLLYSNVVVSIFPKTKTTEVFEFLNKNIFSIQQFLNKKLAMRPVPKIRFELDNTEEEAAKVEALLTKIKESGEL